MILGLEARMLVVTLAAYAVAATLASLILAANWRRLLGAVDALAPRRVARRLLALRSAPALLGTSLAGVAGAAFWRFEPPLGREAVGWPAAVLAGTGAALLAAGLVRSLAMGWASAALTRRWRCVSAARIDGCPLEVRLVQSAFPVVALAGTLRPRLIVASRVAEVCTRDELAAMGEHEMAHLRARDSFGRALFSLSPDALAWLPAAAAMERAWHEAAEQAADEDAGGGDERRRLALASALVKVARLASGAAPAPPWCAGAAASTLFRGEPIADRVRRLVAPPASVERRPPSSRGVLAVVAAVTVAVAVSLSDPRVFEIVEAAIRLGR
jgi:Zn-dependent protease with chaperone function